MSLEISLIINSDGSISVERGKPGSRPKAKRDKGNSLTNTPSNFTVIDIETTGLDPNYDKIIEIGAIKVRDNEVVDTFESLIKPDGQYYYDDDNDTEVFEYVNDFITELTGITNEMLEKAPGIKSVLPNFIDFVKNDILIGHNVNFDINFLYDSLESNLQYTFKNDFVDLMRLTRKLYPEFKNHKLKTVAENLKVSIEGNHRALKDCFITLECFQITSNYIIDNNIDLKALFSRNYSSTDLTTLGSAKKEFDENHILFDKNCVFTGKLERMNRKDAAQIVVDLGGKCLNSVNKKTNFLILGNFNYNATVKGGKSNKLKRAEKLILEGQDLQILSEDVFYDLILDH